jgi:hypothetical protein
MNSNKWLGFDLEGSNDSPPQNRSLETLAR